jgi:hypothetical protein
MIPVPIVSNSELDFHTHERIIQELATYAGFIQSSIWQQVFLSICNSDQQGKVPALSKEIPMRVAPRHYSHKATMNSTKIEKKETHAITRVELRRREICPIPISSIIVGYCPQKRVATHKNAPCHAILAPPKPIRSYNK